MKKRIYLFSLVVLAFLTIVGCSKNKKCTCTSGGIYEIIDSALATQMHFPVPTVIFDTVLTQECFSLNFQDTTDVYYPDYGVIMNEFLTCKEK